MTDPIKPKTAPPPPVQPNVPQAPVSKTEAKELQKELKEALKEIKQAEKWEEYYKDDFENSDRADLSISKAKITSLLAVVDNFLKTGRWDAPAGAGNSNQNDGGIQLIKDMKPGWNGDVEVINTGRPSYLPADVAYAGTVYNTNDDGSKVVALQLDPTATRLDAHNQGSDIVYIETYKDGAGNLKKKAWIGKDQVTNVKTNIGIDAHNLDHGVTINMHKVYRISDGTHGVPYGTPGGFSIIGSDYDDDLIGSQGGDFIAGLKGNNKISGGAGKNEIYGADFPDWAKARGKTKLPDGNNTIYRGTGQNTVDGGGGFNTGVKNDASSTTQHESHIQNHIDVHNTTPVTTSWLDKGPNGWESRDVSPGVVELTETYDPDTDTQPNVLSLKMPDGYDMAFAEETKDGTQSLKITMVGQDANGAPKTFTIIAKGALRPRSNSLKSPFTFKFKGNGKDNIIDFHSVNMRNNLVKISGVAGDDMLIAPTNDLVESNLTLDTLVGKESRISRAELQTKLNHGDIVPEHDQDDARKFGYGVHTEMKDAAGNPVNEIVLSRTDLGNANTKDEKKYIHIDPKAAGFDKAYVMVDPKNANDMLVVLVKQGVAGGPPQTAVIRIKDYDNFLPKAERGKKSGDISWIKFGTTVRGTAGTDTTSATEPEMTTPFTNVVPLIYADLNGDGKQEAGTFLDGGDGTDFIFRAAEDQAVHQESEVTGHYTPGSSTARASGSGSGSDSGSGSGSTGA